MIRSPPDAAGYNSVSFFVLEAFLSGLSKDQRRGKSLVTSHPAWLTEVGLEVT